MQWPDADEGSQQAVSRRVGKNRRRPTELLKRQQKWATLVDSVHTWGLAKLRGASGDQVLKEALGFRGNLSTRLLVKDGTSSRWDLMEIQRLDRAFKADNST